MLTELQELGLSDQGLRDLLDRATRAGVLFGSRGSSLGLAQGSPLSPVLCNAWLHRLDEAMRSEAESRGWSWLRYADDAACLCPDAAEVEVAMTRLEEAVRERGQALHGLKSGVRAVEGWDWLGATWRDGRWESPTRKSKPSWARRKR